MKTIRLLVIGVFLPMACTHQQAQSANKTDQADAYAFANLPAPKPGEAVATFGGGCFWAMEEVLMKSRG